MCVCVEETSKKINGPDPRFPTPSHPDKTQPKRNVNKNSAEKDNGKIPKERVSPRRSWSIYN